MGSRAAGRGVRRPGSPARSAPLARAGLIVALVTAALDQTTKLWLLFVYGLGERGAVAVNAFLDLVLTWNYGISYGLFQQDTQLGRWILVAIKIVAVVLLGWWLKQTRSRLAALCLGLIIGGAIGNAIDRIAYGAVADFLLFHITTSTFRFNWYVFNVADAAIVAGAAGLLYDSVFGQSAAKAP